jgi:hypothetical protein
MDERTITITLAEYNRLRETAVRYEILKTIHGNDTYLSKEDKALYDLTADAGRGVENVDE